MPLLRYFVFVGGALLALLFVCNAVLPQVPLPSTLQSGSDMPAVRIRSDRKWPERIVIDTTVPVTSTATTIAATTTAQPVAAAASQVKPNVREAFAQMANPEPKPQQPTAQVLKGTTVAAAKPAETKAQPKRKVARARPAHPMILVAQQPPPHAGWFDSTW
jgi:hypothetical protein